MKYLANFFVAIDQFGNVLAGGNPDNTISSRVGYYTEEFYLPKKIPFKWKIFRNIINSTFYPMDGKGHCKEAYYNDAGEEFDEGTSDVAVSILAILVIINCLFISIVLYTLYVVGIVSPKKINRTQNIKQRLRIAEAKLQGICTELNTNKVQVDSELDKIIDETQNTLEEIAEKINGILKLKQRLDKFKLKKKRNIGVNKS